TKIYVGACTGLAYKDDYLYFIDATIGAGHNLKRFSLTNKTTEIVIGKAINTFILKENYLFYNAASTAGNYLEMAQISLELPFPATKLTTDDGIDLNVDGDKLYYIKSDGVNTTSGKGIYSVSLTTPTGDQPGTEVAGSKDTNICSLYSVSNILYYYETDTYNLIEYDIRTDIKEEILGKYTEVTTGDGAFVPSFNYGNLIYYSSIANANCLYQYNTTTKTNIKITSNPIDEFSFDETNGKLYFKVQEQGNNSYIMYSLDLNTFENPTKLFDLRNAGQSDSSSNIVNDGKNIYYLQSDLNTDPSAPTTVSIYKANLDGTNNALYCQGQFIRMISYLNDKLYIYEDATSKILTVATGLTGSVVAVDSGIKTEMVMTSDKYVIYNKNVPDSPVEIIVANPDFSIVNKTVFTNDKTNILGMVIKDDVLYLSIGREDATSAMGAIASLHSKDLSNPNSELKPIIAEENMPKDSFIGSLALHGGFVYFLIVGLDAKTGSMNDRFARIPTTGGEIEYL
ncbi:MAG: DUF5050 domain-containing protein, partial [Bacilli bacterium]